MLNYFGEWDAPCTDEIPKIATPVGEECLWCEQPIAAGDGGGTYYSGQITHKECSLRQVMGGIGHHVDHGRYCHDDSDAGLGMRLSSILVWRTVVDHHHFSADDLDDLREMAALPTEEGT